MSPGTAASLKAQTFVDGFALRGGFVPRGAAAAADAVAEP